MQNTINRTAKDHILVCLSSSPSNERIVRIAGRMAQADLEPEGDKLADIAIVKLQIALRRVGVLGHVFQRFHREEGFEGLNVLFRPCIAVERVGSDERLSNEGHGGIQRGAAVVRLTKRGKPIELTQVEFKIIEYFFTHPGEALDRSDILSRAWGDAYFGEEKIVDVNIRRLRMKIEDDPGAPTHIVTVWGMGYKWITE